MASFMSSIGSERSPPAKRPRKISSTRYVRTWTDEEEAYLLRHRRHKMPYKHIAVHLHKTELACRLHYHQMTSSKRTPAARRSMEPPSPVPSFISVFQMESNDSAAWPARNRDSLTLPPICSKLLRAPKTMNSVSQLAFTCTTRDDVDLGRLHHVYADHRKSFWTAIAEAYSGQNVSPYELEAAFFMAQNSSPESLRWGSPSTTSTGSATPMSQPSEFGHVVGSPPASARVHSPTPNRCTVSAILNDYESTPRVNQSCF